MVSGKICEKSTEMSGDKRQKRKWKECEWKSGRVNASERSETRLRETNDCNVSEKMERPIELCALTVDNEKDCERKKKINCVESACESDVESERPMEIGKHRERKRLCNEREKADVTDIKSDGHRVKW